MAAAGPPEQQHPLVDFEADSEDLAWAGEAEAAAEQQQQQQQDRRDAAADADAATAPPPSSDHPSLPPHLIARLNGPLIPDRPPPASNAARPSRTYFTFEPARSADGWVVFATGLHPEAQEEDAIDFFSAAGRVKTLSLGLARATGAVAGHALVEYADEDEARRAVAELDGADFLGERVRVDFAFVKPCEHKGKGPWRGRGVRAGAGRDKGGGGGDGGG